jgi:ribose transport system substrate-binding protein
VACVCCDAEDPTQRISFIGTDKTACGLAEAKALHEKVGDEMKIGVFMGSLDAQDQILQVEGLKQYIAENNLTEAEIIDTQASADAVKTIEVLTAMLTAHPEINCIFGTEGAGPASYGTVLKEMGLTEKVVAIGMDDVETNLAPVREGTIYGVMAQDFYKMGNLAAKYIVDYLNGEEVPDIVDSGVTLVTLENIDTYK